MNTPPAPRAATETVSRSRRFSEPPPTGRGQFQRDRDRIVHSTAFRRLEYETQVFTEDYGGFGHNLQFHAIGIGDLDAKEMLKNRHLARSAATVGFFGFRRQLEYKFEGTVA